MNLIFSNARVFDGHNHELRDGYSVRIAEGVIAEVSDRPLTAQSSTSVDLRGKTLMPGLIDAHYHAYAFALNPALIDQTSPALRALWARRNLEESLQRGFTTIRDAAGGDIALATAIRQGLIQGPRFFFPGLAISQTGGHGDLRAPEHEPLCPCSYCGALSVVADGTDAVRLAAREQLRRGATHIKIFASGGVVSPTDPLWMNQLTDGEIQAAVEEAATRRTYVMAHALTPEAAIRCVRNGVRSIEHALMTSDESAAAIKQYGAYAVPTLSVVKAALREGKALGLTDSMLGKLAELDGHQQEAMEHLRRHEVPLGFGTDLLGPLMRHQSHEFTLRREFQSSFEVLHSATVVNAAILNMTGKLGVIAAGAYADLLVIDGDPLSDITVLEDPAKLQLVVRDGKVCRDLGIL